MNQGVISVKRFLFRVSRGGAGGFRQVLTFARRGGWDIGLARGFPQEMPCHEILAHPTRRTMQGLGCLGAARDKVDQLLASVKGRLGGRAGGSTKGRRGRNPEPPPSATAAPDKT